MLSAAAASQAAPLLPSCRWHRSCPATGCSVCLPQTQHPSASLTTQPEQPLQPNPRRDLDVSGGTWTGRQHRVGLFRNSHKLRAHHTVCSNSKQLADNIAVLCSFPRM